MMHQRLRYLLAVFGLVILAACGGGGGTSASDTGTLIIEVTDGPLMPAQVSEALIGVSRVSIHREASASSGFTELYNGTPILMDLADLRNGVTEGLLAVQLQSGIYKQLRLVFQVAGLRLVNGNEYTTDAGTLDLSSQATSGLKIHLNPPIEVVGGLSTTLLLDFDMSKTYRPTPANEPLDAQSYSLHPVIRAANRSAAGEIRGIVTSDDGTGAFAGVDMAMVYILPPGETNVDNAIATTATDADGSYAVLGLPVGSYDILAQFEALSRRIDGQSVVAGNYTVVDLILQ